MFVYQIQGYDIHNGEKANEIVLSMAAEGEDEAHVKAREMTTPLREYYHTLSAEDIPVEDPGGKDTEDESTE